MPRDSGGTFTRLRRWTTDAESEIELTPERMDEDADDMAAAISDTYGKTQADVLLADKASLAQLALKADKSVVDALVAANGDDVSQAAFDALTATVAGKANSSDVTSALALKISTSEKGATSGVATLDGDGKIPSTQMPETWIDAEIAEQHAVLSHASIISSDLSTNSATRLRDIGVWVVESATTTVAPAVTNGHAYLIPGDATGMWAAQAGKIAYGEGGVWTYKTPAKGWVAYARDSDITRYFDGSVWSTTGGGGSDDLYAATDSRVAGFASVNQQGGGGKFRVHWTVDQRIVVYGDQAAFSYDPAGDNWGPFELHVPWDTSTIRIEKIYQGINYILVQTDQATGNLWHMGSSAHGQGGNGSTSNVGILARIQKFVDDAVKIDAVYTEAGLSHSDAFWFAKTTGGLLYGCGSSGATHTQGYANTANLSTPRKLTYSDGTTAVTGVVSVSCSTVYAPVWALLSSGKAIRWGAGTSGAHGNNNTTAMQWPDALETAPGSGTDRTDIAQVVTTGSAIANTFATTWILTTAGKIESSGSRYYGNGDGAALTSSAVNTFQPASGAIDGLTVTQIAGGGGEYCLCIAITSTSVAYMAGYQGNAQLGGGATTNLNVFTILSGLPSGFSGALTAARVSGANAYIAAYLEATISGVKTIASIGYDGHYNTARGISGTSAGSQAWGTIQGGKGTISAWQVLGDHQIYGIEVLSTDGELRYAGGNDQGQGGVQFGNLHGVPYLQPCRLSGPRIAKPPTWRGAYSAGVAYTERDVVENEGSSWINVLASTGVAPPTLPTEANSNWELLAAKGDKGDTGLTGPSYAATSTTSLAISTGSKSFTTQAGLAYLPGSRLRAASAAAPTTNFMLGTVTAYSSTTLTATVDSVGGSGTYADWNLSIDGTAAADAAAAAASASTATTQAGIATTQAGIATTQATAAGVSAASASTSMANAATAAAAAGPYAAVYQTKAAADAAVAGISANAYVLVLVDETRASATTVYQKISSAHVYRATISKPASPLSGSSFASLCKDKQRRRPVLPWLPDPAYAAEGQQVTITRRSAAPWNATCSGGKWYKDSDESEITPWWVPPGAALVFDNLNGHYYYGGATKTISDFTAITVGGYDRHKLDGQDLGINASGEYTVLIEFTATETGAYSTSGQHLWSMTKTDASGGRNEVMTSTQGVVTMYHARYGTGAAGANYATPSYFPATGSALSQSYVHPQVRGRNRIVCSVPTVGGSVIRGQNGWPNLADGTAVGGSSFSVNRIAFGYRALHGLEDAPLTVDAVYDSMRVVIWPYAMTAAEVTAACRISEQGKNGIYVLADSSGSTQYYASSGIQFFDGMRNTLGADHTYRPMVLDYRGSTSWETDAATTTDTFNMRVNERAESYADFTFVVSDFVWESYANPSIIQNGMLNLLSKLTHNRVILIQNQMASSWTTTQSEYTGSVAAVEYISAWLGDLYWEAFSALAAVGDGGVTDNAAIAKGCIPPSITTDGLHPNPTIGSPALTASAVAKLDDLGWTDSGQW